MSNIYNYKFICSTSLFRFVLSLHNYPFYIQVPLTLHFDAMC